MFSPAGHENGPFVLVGHSFGSPIGRLYAGMNPDDVVGMVWVDGGHEVFYQDFENLIGPAGFNIPGVEYYLPTTVVEMVEQFAAHPVPAVPSVIIEHSRDRERFPNPMKLGPLLAHRPTRGRMAEGAGPVVRPRSWQLPDRRRE